LKNLHYSEEFTRKVLPFLRADYFNNRNERTIFNEISSFITNYGNIPTYEALIIQLNEKPVSEEEHKETLTLLNELHEAKSETVDLEWLVDKTETFCQDQAIFNAVRESITILDGKHKDLSKGSIPTLLSEALSISFDSSVGHDYLGDADSRYDYYHRTEEKVPFSLNYFNLITNGGLPKKTLNVILAPPHGGKSLMMCNFAADFQLSGKNVLYITCEMAEEEIAKRIDANLLRISMDDLMQLDKSSFDKKINYVKSKTIGKLFVKEYPTAAANVNHFRTLLNELRLKKNFVPDVVFIDYLNICASSRMKMSGSINTYTYIQAIAQELRGFAQEFSIPVVTATQTTRSGSQSSDVDMSDVSESFGVPAIADFMCAIINSEELYDLNQIMIKQLKNRYRDLNLNKRFVVGVDRAKMKLFDVEQSAQDGITDAGSMDPSESYKSMQKQNKFEKKSFDGFKV
jgi:archaellum biogenesis ATPase FlaH